MGVLIRSLKVILGSLTENPCLAKTGGFAVLTVPIAVDWLCDRTSLEYRNKVAVEKVSMSGALMLELVVEQS